MTNPYLKNTTADYITGVVSACEGIKDSLVLLNGPLGCRFYHCYASGQSIVKESELWGLRGELRLEHAMEDKLIRSQYFAGTPQVPGTNLRYEDYIFGSREQLHRALNDIFAERPYSLFTVIQTPGTSLLGEALEGELQEISEEFGIPYLFVETPQLSENMFLGYDDATVRLLDRLVPNNAGGQRRGGGPSVNVFGFYTYGKYLEGGVNEIRKLLELCGIGVNCVVGANCTLDDFRRIPEADASIVLSPERCRKTADYLKEQYGKPVLETGGMPIGFDLTEKFVRAVSDLPHTDCKPAMEYIRRSRGRAFYYIARYLGSKGFPKDLRYAAEAESSALLGYVDFLSGYLGIKPQCIHPLYLPCGGREQALLEETLSALHAEDALQRDISQVSNVILLANANTIVERNTYGENIYGIETANPSSGYIHVVPKTHIGCAGALYLLEQILNGVKLLSAWK